MNKLIVAIFVILLSCEVQSQTSQWRDLSSIPPTGRYEDIYFINANTGWTVTYNKIYKTTDAGTTWKMYNLFGPNRSLGFFNADYGIAGTLNFGNVMSRTTDGGISWAFVSNFNPDIPDGICGISIIDEDNAVACGTYYSSAMIYSTTDKGQNWNRIFYDTAMARSLVDCYFWNKDTGIAAGGYNINEYLNGRSVVIRTTNGGASWNRVYMSSRTNEWGWKINFRTPDKGVVSIERFPNYGLSYFLKTTDRGLTWTEHPFMAYDQEGIGFINDDVGWIGGHSGNPYQTTDGGVTWKQQQWGNNLNRIRMINDNLCYAAGKYISKYSPEPVAVHNYQTVIPEGFFLSQNYPNPFNPLTLIEFGIPAFGNNNPGLVKLTVYDQSGKVVKKLMDDVLPPGSYEASFDAGYYPSGVYFYKLETYGFSQTKKMVVLK